MTLPSFRLDGRTALITGASRGIGRAIASGVAEAGADVIAVARSAEALKETGGAGRGGRAPLPGGDGRCLRPGRDRADVRGDRTRAGLTADVLLNNAGMEEVRPAVDVDEALWGPHPRHQPEGRLLRRPRLLRSGCSAPGAAGRSLTTCSLTSAVGGADSGALYLVEGGPPGDDAGPVDRVGVPRHPGQRHRPRLFPDRTDRGLLPRPRTGSGRCSARSRWAGSATSTTWSARRCSWPPTPPLTSPASCCSSTAATWRRSDGASPNDRR